MHLAVFDGGLASWAVAAIGLVAGLSAALFGLGAGRTSAIVGGVALLAAVSCWIGPAFAQESQADLQALLAKAQSRVDQAQGELGDWAASLQGRGASYQAQAASVKAALEAQINRGAQLMDDPALRSAQLAPAGAIASNKGGVYLAVSLSMPPEALSALARDAHRAGVHVVIRGLVDGSFKATLAKVKLVFDDHSAGGVAIDPQVFKAFDVKAVPTFIATEGPVQPCGSLGCAPAAPAFDKVAGNISLEAALRILETDGSAGRAPAHSALAKLSG